MPPVPRPSCISNFAATYRCNSRCTTCNIWKREPGDELSLSEIKDFLASNRDLLGSVSTVQLTGGEPFLRGDLCGIAEAFWEELPGCMVWVATNGLLPEVVEAETQRMLNGHGGPLGVTVSLDGVGLTHDVQRGVKGGYEKAIRTLRLLSELSRGDSSLSVSAGLTLTPLNLYEVDAALAVVESLGANFTVRPENVSAIYYGNEATTASWDWKAVDDALGAVARHHIRNRKYLRSLPVLTYLRGMSNFMVRPCPRPGCSAASASFFLAPNGDIYPCLMMGERMGNVVERTFVEVWSGEPARRVREMIASGSCPGCWVECETMREVKRDRTAIIREFFLSLPLLLS